MEVRIIFILEWVLSGHKKGVQMGMWDTGHVLFSGLSSGFTTGFTCEKSSCSKDFCTFLTFTLYFQQFTLKNTTKLYRGQVDNLIHVYMKQCIYKDSQDIYEKELSQGTTWQQMYYFKTAALKCTSAMWY